MNISELNASIFSLESRISDLQAERDMCIKASKRSFSFADNWRDKQSYIIRIPTLSKEIEKIKAQLAPLKTEKETYNTVVAYQKMKEEEQAKLTMQLAEERAKLAEEQAIKIGNPIALLEIE